MKRKKLLLSFIVIVVFLMIATLGLYYLVDLNSHKPRIETALSNALGLDVRIKGNIGFVLFPNLHISIGDIKITGKEWDIASLEKVKFGLKLLPLLKGRFSIDKIDIKLRRCLFNFIFEAFERWLKKKRLGLVLMKFKQCCYCLSNVLGNNKSVVQCGIRFIQSLRCNFIRVIMLFKIHTKIFY